MENNENKPESVQGTAPAAPVAAKAGKPAGTWKAKWCGKWKGIKSEHKKAALGLLVLILIVAFAAYKKNPNAFGNLFPKTITQDQAKTVVTNFIQQAGLVPQGTKIDITSVTEENGLYKIMLSISGQTITSYLTKDGTKFFPEAMDIAQLTQQAQSGNQQASAQSAPQDVPKTDVPDVKLFVMSYCPYGTQMEKAILPVVQALGNKIKYTLEFVDYSMHGDKEIAENLRQYCIEKTQPAKLSNYLTCFLKVGQGTENSCMTTAGVDSASVSSCVAQTDAQFNVTKDAADKTTWVSGQYPTFNVEKADNVQFGVQGSPTLIINGVEAQVSSRDSASVLKTICAAFNNAPKECSTQLSSAAPAAGFGTGTAASGAAPANCATPAAPAPAAPTTPGQ